MCSNRLFKLLKYYLNNLLQFKSTDTYPVIPKQTPPSAKCVTVVKWLFEGKVKKHRDGMEIKVRDASLWGQSSNDPR